MAYGLDSTDRHTLTMDVYDNSALLLTWHSLEYYLHHVAQYDLWFAALRFEEQRRSLSLHLLHF